MGGIREIICDPRHTHRESGIFGQPDIVCNIHGWYWPEGREFCNSFNDREVSLILHVRKYEPDFLVITDLE